MLHRLKRDGKFAILFTISVLSIIVPSLTSNEDLFQLVFMIMFSAMVISGAATISISKKLERRAMAFAAFTLIVSWILYLDIDLPLPDRAQNIPFLAFFLFIVYYLIASMLKSKVITLDLIFGAISGYIFLGFTGAIYFITIHDIYPHSFGDTMDHPMNPIYFSFVSMTTLGYGDIVPVTNAAKGGVILITILGQFYLAVIVAMMVSKYLVEAKK